MHRDYVGADNQTSLMK